MGKEQSLVTALQAQLASATTDSAKAKIQKKINSATALENKFAAQETSVSNSATAALTNIASAEMSIQAQENAL